MPFVNDFEIVNHSESENAKEGSARSAPPPPPPSPSNQNPSVGASRGDVPEALRQAGAIVAAIVVRNVGEGFESDSEDSDDDSLVCICCGEVPFRIRTASTPAEIGGNEMVDAADNAMDAVLAQRLARAKKML